MWSAANFKFKAVCFPRWREERCIMETSPAAFAPAQPRQWRPGCFASHLHLVGGKWLINHVATYHLITVDVVLPELGSILKNILSCLICCDCFVYTSSPWLYVFVCLLFHRGIEWVSLTSFLSFATSAPNNMGLVRNELQHIDLPTGKMHINTLTRCNIITFYSILDLRFLFNPRVHADLTIKKIDSVVFPICCYCLFVPMCLLKRLFCILIKLKRTSKFGPNFSCKTRVTVPEPVQLLHLHVCCNYI